MGKGEPAGRTRGTRPLYGQIRHSLVERIGRREWQPGEALPNEAALAAQFAASVGTVRRAIEGLEASGFIERRQGIGTFVVEHGPTALEQRFTPLFADDGAPLALAYHLLRIEQRRATDSEAVRLRCPAGAAVVAVVQRLVAAGRTVGIEASTVPATAMGAIGRRLRRGRNLYPVLAAAGLLAHRTDDRLHIADPDGRTAELLALARGVPVLFVERTTYAVSDEVIELRSARYVTRGLFYRSLV